MERPTESESDSKKPRQVASLLERLVAKGRIDAIDVAQAFDELSQVESVGIEQNGDSTDIEIKFKPPDEESV